MTDDDAPPESPAPWAAPGHERRSTGRSAPAPRPGPCDWPAPADPYGLTPAATPPSGTAEDADHRYKDDALGGGATSPRAAPRTGGALPAQPFATTTAYRESVFAGPGYSSPAYRNDRVAVASLVLGLLGVVVPGICLIAVALGHLGLHRLRASYRGGRGLAVAGLVLGYIMTAVWLAVLVLRLVTNAM